MGHAELGRTSFLLWSIPPLALGWTMLNLPARHHSCRVFQDWPYLLFYKQKHLIETFMGHWTWPNGCRLLSELSSRHWNSIFNRFLPPEDLFSLLTKLLTFLIYWPLSLAASCVYWCWSCFVCSGLTYEVYSEGGSSIYVYGMKVDPLSMYMVWRWILYVYCVKLDPLSMYIVWRWILYLCILCEGGSSIYVYCVKVDPLFMYIVWRWILYFCILYEGGFSIYVYGVKVDHLSMYIVWR